MKSITVLLLICILKIYSQDNTIMFERVEYTSDSHNKFESYLDSLKTINKYQIKINTNNLKFDTLVLNFNDKEIFNLVLLDTLKDYFGMLCLKYNVMELNSEVLIYSFDNNKRFNFHIQKNDTIHRVENIDDEHLYFSYKMSDIKMECGVESNIITQNKNNYSDIKNENKNKLLTSVYEECLIRICVGYTQSAIGILSLINIRNRILQEIQNTNLAYQNSDVDLEIEVSRSTFVDDYNDVNDNATNKLNKFTNDQTLNIQTLKQKYDSDMLSILANFIDPYGIARSGGHPDFDYDSTVSITSLSAGNVYTFAHELGHNQGCQHNYTINNNQNPPKITRENIYFDYGHAFYSASIGKYSIVKQDPAYGTVRVLYFSNPDIIIDGINFGENGNMDNAKVLEETKKWIMSNKTIPVDYVLSNIFPSGETIEEADITDISAFETIDLDEDFETEIHSIVTIKAGEEVRIGPGFHAQAGSNVHAYIKDQNCYSSSKKVFADGESVIGNESKFSLSPNPTSGNAIATVEVGEKSICSLTLLDNLGNEVITIFKDKELDPGKYQYDLEANNLSNGIYLCVLRIGSAMHSEKLVYLK